MSEETISESRRREHRKREKAVEDASIAAKAMYKPENIEKKEDKEMTIILNSGQKQKIIEEVTYKNGVVKRHLKAVIKDGKKISGKG